MIKNLLAVLVLLGVLSILVMNQDGAFNAMPTIEVSVLSIFVFGGVVYYNDIFVAIAILSYIISYTLRSWWMESDMIVLLISLKVLIYLLIAKLYSGRTSFISISVARRFYIWFLLLAFLKYSLYMLSTGLTRPGLWVENNFEIVLFVLLYPFLFGFSLRNRIFISLLLVIILSGSRSGMALIFMLILFSKDKSIRPSVYVMVKFFLVAAFIFIAAGVLISNDRFNILESDRFLFMLSYWEEVKYRGWANFILGPGYLRALNHQICGNLSFYNKVFGSEIQENCYSVLLHGGLWRVLLDYGVLMTIFIHWFWYNVIMKTYSRKEATYTLIITILSSLSISGLYSTMWMLAILIVLSLRNGERDKKISI